MSGSGGPLDLDPIRADVKITDESEKWSDRYHDAVVRLLHCVEPLVAEVEHLRDDKQELLDTQDNLVAANLRLHAERKSLRAQLAAVDRRLAPAELFDSMYDAMYGGMNAGAEERESVAQLCEALSPLLRASVAASWASDDGADQ